jgi:hypothetical protein
VIIFGMLSYRHAATPTATATRKGSTTATVTGRTRRGSTTATATGRTRRGSATTATAASRWRGYWTATTRGFDDPLLCRSELAGGESNQSRILEILEEIVGSRLPCTYGIDGR